VEVSALAGVVLGAVLALGSGVLTERLKERRDARAAARLVWLELLAGWGVVFGTVVQNEWAKGWRFSDEAWTGHRDRLALALADEEFRLLQSVYLALRDLSQVPLDERPEPVLVWPLLVLSDRAVLRLGEVAGIDESQLRQFRTPVAERVARGTSQVGQLRAMVKDGLPRPTDETIAKALDDFPPELRPRAADALARTLRRSQAPEANDT
jgi:hypothetical protein